jgi:hypothetical protein
MTTHKVERKVSTRAQKVAAVEQVRYNCEHGLYTRTAHIQKEYGVHHVVGMLLEKGIIVENGTPHKYKWNTTLPALEVVDSIWHLHGKEPVAAPSVKKILVQEGAPKPMEQVDVVQKSTDITEKVMGTVRPKLDIEAAAKHSTEMQHKRLQEELSTCLYMCKEYGISNVSKYIADVLIRKGFRFQ